MILSDSSRLERCSSNFCGEARICSQRLLSCSKHERRYFIWSLWPDLGVRAVLQPTYTPLAVRAT